MEVTRKEGLGWEANMVAHVSEVLLIFITFLNLSDIIYIEENHKVAKF